MNPRAVVYYVTSAEDIAAILCWEASMADARRIWRQIERAEDGATISTEWGEFMRKPEVKVKP